MNRLKILFALQFLIVGSGLAQTFTFPFNQPFVPAFHHDKVDVRVDSGRITCLYRISGNKEEPTVFRKVFLDERLRPFDSVDFTIPGRSQLIANEANEKYTVHVFYSEDQDKDFLQFIVTEKSGKIHSTFTKSGADFTSFFSGKVKKTKRISLTFVENVGSPELLIITPTLVLNPGKTFACSIEDGHWLWTLDGPDMDKIITTENELIGLSNLTGGLKNTPDYTVHFFNKKNGARIHSEPFYSGKGFRLINVVASNGQEFMIAGTEHQKKSTGQFYMTMFDLTGKRIFDRVDARPALSFEGMHPLGHAFDRDGNLFIIGEGWDLDFSRGLSETAISLLFAATLGTTPTISAAIDQKITNLVMAKISTADGTVKDFYTFPIGPWWQFSDLTSDGEHVLISNSRMVPGMVTVDYFTTVLLYNPDAPNTPPVNFAALNYLGKLIIAPFGPVAVNEGKKTVGLELLHTNH